MRADNINGYCPYVTHKSKGKDVADTVLCSAHESKCFKCGWYPPEATRRTHAIIKGYGVVPITVLVGTYNDTIKRVINQKAIPECNALVLTLLEEYEDANS